MPDEPDEPRRAEVIVRCVRAPLWPQVLCAVPAALWLAHTLITDSWSHAPVTAALTRTVVAAATPPLASLFLRFLYRGSGTLIPGPILLRFGRRAIRGVEIADGRAALDAGHGGAFVVGPSPGWLQQFGSAPWQSTAPVRWIASGVAATIFAVFTVVTIALPLLGTPGLVLQFAMLPVGAVLIPAVLVVNLIGLWPVSRRVGPLPPRATIISSGSG